MICWRKFEKRIGMSLTYNGQAIIYSKYILFAKSTFIFNYKLSLQCLIKQEINNILTLGCLYML